MAWALEQKWLNKIFPPRIVFKNHKGWHFQNCPTGKESKHFYKEKYGSSRII